MQGKDNQPQSSQNDEIDLLELFKVIWSYKKLTAIFVVIAIAVSVTYSLKLPEKWVSTAQVMEPQLNDISDFYVKTKTVTTILADTEMNKINKLATPANLFANFILNFNSSVNKNEFLAQNKIFLEYLDKNKIEVNGKGYPQALDTWSKGIAFDSPKEKGNAPIKLSFHASEQKRSATLLTEYIAFITKKVQVEQFIKLYLFIETSKEFLKREIEITEIRTQRNYDNLIEKTKLSYQIAKEANINDYQVNLNKPEDPLFQISLGSKALKAKLDALKGTHDLSLINPSISQKKITLDALNNLSFDAISTFIPYHFVQNVQEPLNRLAPKRSLIVLLSTLMAGMLSIFIGLIHHFLTKK